MKVNLLCLYEEKIDNAAFIC